MGGAEWRFVGKGLFAHCLFWSLRFFFAAHLLFIGMGSDLVWAHFFVVGEGLYGSAGWDFFGAVRGAGACVR